MVARFNHSHLENVILAEEPKLVSVRQVVTNAKEIFGVPTIESVKRQLTLFARAMRHAVNQSLVCLSVPPTRRRRCKTCHPSFQVSLALSQ